MSVIERVGFGIVSPLIAMGNAFVDALPGVFFGIIILLFGYLLGIALEKIIIAALKRAKFEKFIHSLKISSHFEKFDVSHFIGVMIKWYIVVIFLIQAASLARLGQLSILLLDFARWMPKFLVAVLIVLFGWIAVDVLSSRIESTKIKSKHMVSVLTRVVLLAFVFVIALDQIGVNLILLHETYLILLSAIGFGFALAIGIGFGLAMKDDAKQAIRNIKKKI